MEKYTLPAVIEKDEYGYFAMCPALQGCYSQGNTYEEALENIKDAIRLHIEDILESGETIEKINSFSLVAFEITA
jgi:predicted RNase H-like HicB family nuclease